MFIVNGFILNLAALIAGFHGPQHTAAGREPFKLQQHRLFHQFGELLDDE